MTTFISAHELARRWGLKTETLSKWRRLGKGPQGWKRQSKTRVIYPLAEVEKCEADLSDKKPGACPPPFTGCRHPLSGRRSFGEDGASRVVCSSCGETIEPRMIPQEAEAR